MRDVLPQLEAWMAAGEAVGTAMVVGTWGSAPRPVGSVMGVTAAGGVVGSVSGGCVETAVAEAAREAVAGGRARLVDYGVGDEAAWSVGLSCGGRLAVLVAPLRDDAVWAALRAALAAERPAAVVTLLAGPRAGDRLLATADGDFAGTLGDPDLDAAARDAATRALAAGDEPARVALAGADVFVAPYPPRPRLVVVGAVHVAAPLLVLARDLGFRTVLVDPRAALATPERFPAADEILHDWPATALAALRLHSGDALATLTHDPKLDLPALRTALAGPAGYVGALGSRRTHETRLAALRDAGVADADLARIHAPIGLDLGGRTAPEIALAVLAQIVAVRHGRSGR